MRITQKQIVLQYIRDHGGWVKACTLKGLNTKYGFIGSEADKRCYELEKDGLLIKDKDGKFTTWKAKPPQRIETYIARNPDGSILKVIEVPIYE